MRHIHKHKEASFEKKLRSWILHHTRIIFWVGAGFGLFIISIGLFWFASMEMPTLDSFETRKTVNSTKIYDRTGTVVLYDIHQNIKRTSIASEQMAQSIKDAAVAIEDKNFYQHRGIQVRAIIRAIVQNLSDQGVSQGGSTITQQVVKNTLLTADKSIARKLKEWILALRLERAYSKDQILTAYLNESPYGGAIYGVEQASQTFFGKKAIDVTIAESAYLAAIPNAPTFFSPYGTHKKELDDRKNIVLKNMRDMGFITEEDYASARDEVVTFRPLMDTHSKALHFVEYVRQIIESRYGADMVESGGLKVTTTLDWDLQKRAEEIVAEGAARNASEWNAENQALVALDPKTGDILAMVGSRGYSDPDIDGTFNVVTQGKRQPGSAFKPIIYSRAFEKGFRPETVLFDVRTQFSSECQPNNFSNTLPCYSPENYDGLYQGPISLRNALGQSRNIPAVKLLYLVGIEDALRTAKNLGIETLDRNANRYGLTLVLGGGEVTLLDLASAYGVFANDGVLVPHTGILKIENSDGVVLEESNPRGSLVMNPQATRLLNSVLSDNVARTPLFGANSFLTFQNQDVAGKTGTTNDNRDAWLLGYTPNLVVGVWSGNNNNTPMKKGSAISGPSWRTFMDTALRKRPIESFPDPDPVSPDTKPVIRGLWWGNESFSIDTVSGKLATDFTPPETRKEFVIPNLHTILHWITPGDPLGDAPSNPESNDQYKRWEYVESAWIRSHAINIPYPPAKPNEEDDVHTKDNQPVVTITSPVPGSTVREGDTVTISVSIDQNYPIKTVDYYANATFLGTVDRNPFSYTFNLDDIGITEGDLTLRAVATDSVYNRGEKEITIRVR